MDAETIQRQIIAELQSDRRLAHRVLFKHRHTDEDPGFHLEIIDLFSGTEPKVAVEAFRGGAKSTRSEEFVILEASNKKARYIVLIGNSYERACERLSAVKHEIETNETLIEVYGNLIGPTWAHDEIVLSTGVKIQALGARQSMRGLKHNDQRPDLIVVDDIEDEENVATEDARDKMWRWVMSVMLPALAPGGRIRFLGTPLHPMGVMERLSRLSGWVFRRYPIMVGGTPTWASRFPLLAIEELRRSYEEAGALNSYAQEYLCQSEDVALKPFQQRHIIIEAVGPLWAPRYAMVDPARTTDPTKSARTGYAIWSWVGSHLHVHEAYGAFHKPDEIVNEIFRINAAHHPIFIGVEKDGLEEFLMQPIRIEMVKRGESVPVRGLRAPRDKIRFITGLQPFFEAKEVFIVGEQKDLVSELLAFPTGRKDVVNALAYALNMRPGRPVYEDFREHHVVEGLSAVRKLPVWISFNGTASATAAVMVQYADGMINIIGDWMLEGTPEDSIKQILQEGRLLAAQQPRPVLPTDRMNEFDPAGMRAAFRALRVTPAQGSMIEPSRGSLSGLLRESRRDLPVLMVDTRCHWVIGALAGGYARELKANGLPEDRPAQNQYSLVAEALEAFVAWFGEIGADDGQPKNYVYTEDGRRYISSLPQRRR